LDRTTDTAPQADIPAIVPVAPGNEEVFREYVRVLAEHERLSLLANLPGIVLIAITALFLPFGRFVVGAALLRLVAVSLTRWRGRALRRALADGEPLARPVNTLGVAVGFSGFTWALVLWPIAIHGVAEPAAALLIVYVCMGVPLLAVLAASIPRLMWAFAGSFFLTMCLEIGLNPGGDGTLLMLGLAGLFVTVVSAGRAMQRQQSKASLATLEKIALARALAEANEELAEALAQAEFLSQRDPLTGLSNRRAFMESSTHAEPCARRRHLLAIDLDHFKQVNDTFGHAVGDRVLIGVGDVLRDSIRGRQAGWRGIRHGARRVRCQGRRRRRRIGPPRHRRDFRRPRPAGPCRLGLDRAVRMAGGRRAGAGAAARRPRALPGQGRRARPGHARRRLSGGPPRP